MIQKLFKKEKNNTLEVEDILAVVRNGTKDDVSVLKELRLEIFKTDTFSTRSIPFDKWIDAVCDFLTFGYDKMVEIATSNSDQSYFAIKVLNETYTYDGLQSILKILNASDLTKQTDYIVAIECMSAINLMISFDAKIDLSEKDIVSVRQLIHRYLEFVKNNSAKEIDISAAYYALRKVGDNSSIELLESLPPFTESGLLNTLSTVKSAIKKSMRSRSK